MATTTYYLRNTTSDQTGGADFNYSLLTSTATASSLVVSIASSATEDSYAFTDVAVPGAIGTVSSISVEINVTSNNSNINLSAAVSRINSSGVVQATSSFTAEQTATPTGVKTFSISSPGLGTWASGDRLRVIYRFRNTSGMAGQTVTIGVNSTNEEVVVTSVAAYTMAADAGAFVLTGASVDLLAARTLSTAAASFILTGSAVGLLKGSVLAANAGTFTLTASAVTLSKGFTLSAAAAAMSLTGSSLGLVATRLLSVSPGSYNFTGAAAGLYRGFSIGISAVAFALAGASVDFPLSRVLTGSSGALILTGASISLGKGLLFSLDAAAFVLSGTDLEFKLLRFEVAEGAFSLTLNEAQLSPWYRHYRFFGETDRRFVSHGARTVAQGRRR